VKNAQSVDKTVIRVYAKRYGFMHSYSLTKLYLFFIQVL